MAELAAAVQRVLPSVRADLERLVRIPSVSVADFDQSHVRASAEAVATLFREAGAADVQILSVPGGAPAVVATYPAPEGAPTALLYAHHDVQPPGPDELWESPAFEPTERDGRLYARGAADDKAGIAAHLAALRAYDGKPPVGVTIFVEGEEEIGSPTLGQFLAAYRDRLASDMMVLADSGNWAIGQPALTVSLRGLVDCYVNVRVLEKGVHSGMFGGAVPDALTALCRLVATLHDEEGHVAIPGFGPAMDSELDIPEDRLRAEAGMLDGVGLIGSGRLTSRVWNQPALSVLAIDAPPTKKASNTLLASARAKLSLRVPPGSDAKAAYEALVKHLHENAPWGVQVTVDPGEIGQPYAIDATGPRYDAARQAFADAWGVEPVNMGIGGSVPFLAEFADQFPEAALLVTGVEDPASGAHGPNESLHLGEFAKVCLAETLLLDKLSRL
ncbi:dipeptidase [Fodinicola acaciae]|uniref:dipeptidase n=1 Tax=Fodinicola acaciae TaxID=2681555 RepID=UPI001651F85E|nr:dipeptidase [Fodinicola acaciae]